MFLKQLYHYNKYWLAAFLLFIAAYFFINYKAGLVASPVYQFGMYSGRFSISDTQHVYLFRSEEKLLDVSNLPFAERDMIYVLTDNYFKQKTLNSTRFNTLQHLYSKLAMAAVVKEDSYTNNITDSLFTNWLSTYLKKRGIAHNSIQIELQQFIWQDGEMIKITR